MEIKVGQKWKCRDGTIVEVKKIRSVEWHPYQVDMSDGTTRTLSGKFFHNGHESVNDLIEYIKPEEYKSKKHYKLLIKEIKVKDYNDVTEIIENDEDINADLVNFEIKEISTLSSNLLEIDSIDDFKYRILYTVKVKK